MNNSCIFNYLFILVLEKDSNDFLENDGLRAFRGKLLLITPCYAEQKYINNVTSLQKLKL